MSASPHRTMTMLEWALLSALSFLWGASFLFVAVAVAELSPTNVVTARLIIAAAALYFTIRLMGLHLPRDGLSWRDFSIMGFLNNVIPFSLIAWGQVYVASGLASIYIAATPLFTVVIAHILADNERITPLRTMGVLIGFAGVAVMIGPSALFGIGSAFLPQLAVLTAAFVYGLSAVFALRFSRRGVSPLASATGQMICASLIMTPIALIAERQWSLALPSIEVIAAVVALAVLSTALGYIIYYRILSTAGSVNVMLVTLLIPVTAVLLGGIVLGERLETRQFLGMGAIGLGLAFIDGRFLEFARPTPPRSKNR